MVLVARHHGRQITRSLDPTGGRPPANRNKTGRSILKSEGDSEYERRVKQKKTWQGDNQEWLGQNHLTLISGPYTDQSVPNFGPETVNRFVDTCRQVWI